MKIVFLTNSYYPYYSAIGKCIKNVIDELEKKHEIIVISNMEIGNLSTTSVVNKHKVVRIRPKNLKNRDVNKKSNQSPLIKKINHVMLQSEAYLKLIASKYSLDKQLIKEFDMALNEIENIDVIIPTCYPFEAVMAALKQKRKSNKSIKVIPLLFDKFSDSPTLHRNALNKKIKYNNNFNLEQYMMVNSDHILYVDSWIKRFSESAEQAHEKITHIEHPLIINPVTKPYEKKELLNNIKIVYTGVLDKIVRPPHKSVEFLFQVINKEKNINIDFYILGNCGHIIDEYQKKSNGKIKNHGQIESAKAIEALVSSDILLSIGNTDTSLIPSKVFEYMSIGKPIIHFYNENDTKVNSMLNQYDLALCINQNEPVTDEKIDEIISFIKNNKDKIKLFNEVEKDFEEATPKYLAEKIESLIK